MPDKNLTCRDCGREFLFTVGEQEFYAQKGFAHEPRRCPDCRATRRAAPRDQAEAGSYTSGGYSTGIYTSGGYSTLGYGERPPREMFAIVCARCGKDAQVPFQPRTDRPVYCSDCFQQERAARSGESRTGRPRW